jgi:methylenetetrahydrofolate dehydrogenase (NADP+)/methenyltetrahydrofolate cyclohydrolase
VQLPLIDQDTTDEIVADIPAIKDVDGLSNTYSDLVEHEDGLITIDNPDTREHYFDSATATAILWLLAGHNIDFEGKRIAVVGRGKLVGRPLMSMWTKSGNTVHVFHRGSDFSKLKDFDVIVTATGAPHLITNEMIRPGAVVVDAGTASEQGKLVGDISDEIRARNDLGAITPKVGGVGPLTINVLFENVIIAASKQHKK